MMQLLKTLYAVLLAVGLVLFAPINWGRVTIYLWDGLEADVPAAALVVFGFLLGFLPTFCALLTEASRQLWQAILAMHRLAHTTLARYTPLDPRQPKVVLVTALALLLGAGVYSQSTDSARLLKQAPHEIDFACTVATVNDGDTFRCAEVDQYGKQIRVRLAGVAAREVDGSCQPNHPCPIATAEAATAELERLALGQSLICRQVGSTFDRRAAFCQIPVGPDLSCAMLSSGTVARWEEYWGDQVC